MKKKLGKWNTLDAVLQAAWTMLERGAARFNDPFHWPVLGTSSEDGCRLRTVILRRFVPPERMLVCHTDARAAKVNEINRFSGVSWLFYHPRRKIQLRISGQATLHSDDPFAEEQWSTTTLTSRLNYCTIEAPGTAVDRPSSGLPDLLLNKVPTLLETQCGRKNFMAVACRIESMDWLRLSVLGNRRARFDWGEDGLTAKWLIP